MPSCAQFAGVWRRSLFVGYAQNGLKSGATMVTPQFLNVSGEAMPIETLIPTGDDASDSVSIQTLSASGKTVDMYTWNDWANDEPCWVDDNLLPVTGVVFASGQGLWVTGSSDGQGIQSAGKVGTADVVVTLRKGATPTGIPFPVAINLNDILPAGDDISDTVSIQTLSASGKTVSMYTWNDWANDEPCWVDDNLLPVTDVVFQPGEGLWVTGSSLQQTLTFPAPEL